MINSRISLSVRIRGESGYRSPSMMRFELAQQHGGLFVGKVKLHDPHMGALILSAERFDPIFLTQ